MNDTFSPGAEKFEEEIYQSLFYEDKTPEGFPPEL